MAYPIHPSRSDNDLKYSVLYDDFSAENAIQIIRDLDRDVPFPPAPDHNFRVKVIYTPEGGGTLNGVKEEWVQYGETPSNSPFPTTDARHEFLYWEDQDGNRTQDPESIPVYKDTYWTAYFESHVPRYTVTYEVYGEGTLTDSLTEIVEEGNTPVNVPIPVPAAEHLFDYWEMNGYEVIPSETAIYADTTFTAVFREDRYIITMYDVKPTTTSPTDHGVTVHTYYADKGQSIPLTGFTDTTAGPTVDEDGNYLDVWNEVADRDKWYQRIQNTQNLTANTNYYRKTFLAAVGGHFTSNNQTVYAITSTVSTWSTITAPTPVPDDGWEFVQWINLATGATVSNPSSGNNTSRTATVYVAIFREKS